MNILVIGNGFDIAHGLPTKYSDFLDFLRKYYQFKNSDDISREEDESFMEIIRLKNEKIELFHEIEILTKDNAWYQHFDSIYEDRKAEGKDCWIDFESEISNVIQTIDKIRSQIRINLGEGVDRVYLNELQINQLKIIIWGNYHLDFESISFDMFFIKQLKRRLLDDMDKIIRCLEIYLSCCVHMEKCLPLSIVENLNIHCVLSFNYTDTYKILYDDGTKSIKYHHIHGIARQKSDIESCNMILGIDEYLDNSSKNSDNEFVEFKKFFQRILKGTGNIYTEWNYSFQKKITPSERLPDLVNRNVYIYGHSLDNTDGDVLRNLILQENTNTTIFYHTKEALGKQIANLVAVIGEDELIRRTDKATQTIFFKSTANVT